MRNIIIKIKFCAPVSGKILNEVSKILERYLKRNKIDYGCIDASIECSENDRD